MSFVEHLAKERVRTRRVKVTPLQGFVALNIVFSLAIVLAFALSVETWGLPALGISTLILVNAIWISGGATTAILGLIVTRLRVPSPPQSWQPDGRTAILVTVCGEAPDRLADYLHSFAKGLSASDLGVSTEVFVLSDTSGAARIARERAALSPLINTGLITYRRRAENTDKKPGNIAEWLVTHGDRFDYMVVKDADSRMTVCSIRDLMWRIERSANTGLVQAGIALVPGRTWFGQHQRIASRLLSRNFGRGFAAWSGKTANYWGHNAIMRVTAFRAAAPLPHLPGTAPFGGAILSHDFVEAAWMRRAGWDIELAPDIRGSAEDAPQTLTAFFRRDRRWCQGNLQHLRIVGQPGLHGLSRFHFVTGIFSYLAAPIWLLLVVALSSGIVSVSGYAPALMVAAVLLVPKICALIDILPRARTRPRRRTILKAWVSELVISALIAPLILMRHAASVLAIALGRDCGWKAPHATRWQIRPGWVEGAAGLVVLGFALLSGPVALIWLSAIYLPLLSGPLLVPALNRPAR